MACRKPASAAVFPVCAYASSILLLTAWATNLAATLDSSLSHIQHLVRQQILSAWSPKGIPI